MVNKKIFIQKPWKFSDSPYYQYLRKRPPSGFEYVNPAEFNLFQSKSKFRINTFLKQNIKRFIKLVFPSMPNAHYTKNSNNYDLIHCAHCLSLNNKPWVADIEWVGQFFATGNADKRKRKEVLKILRSKNCKKILAWTNWSLIGILKFVPEIKDKVELVYPGIPVQKFKKRNKKEITLLYSSRRFFFKGGLHALHVMDKLTKEYENVNAIIVSDTPNEIINQYSKNKKIKFYPLLSQEEVFKNIYPESDIFLYPSYNDTFGFGLTEALSFGLPVVTVEGMSRREIIEDNKTGFVINRPKKWDVNSLKNVQTINELYEKTKELIIDSKLRKKMSQNAINEIKNGKFSIERRNKILKKAYNEALI